MKKKKESAEVLEAKRNAAAYRQAIRDNFNQIEELWRKIQFNFQFKHNARGQRELYARELYSIAGYLERNVIQLGSADYFVNDLEEQGK